jgi:hypothetical protein
MPLYFPFANRRLLASLNAVSSNINNTETVVLQALLPAGSWRPGTMIEFPNLCATKSGTTDSGTIKIRVGAAGTSADTQILTNGSLGAANRTWNGQAVMRLDGVSSVLPIGGNSGGFQQGTSNSALAAISLGAHDTSATATYVSVTLASSSTNDTVALAMGSIWMVDRIG